MPYGLPNVSYIGFPVSVLCPGHSGLGFREAHRPDAPALIAHFRDLDREDRRKRFCATLTDAAIERHVDGLWGRRGIVLAAHDGPLWPSPLHRAGPIRAVAELSMDDREAELGISVDPSLRRRGVGTYLIQTAASLLASRGIREIRAYTIPGNTSFIALARAAGARVESGPDEIEVHFDVPKLHRAYLRRRAVQAFRPAA